MSWRRPSNRSSSLALPSGPSNTYSFSTASHGIRRRSAASASRARVNSFSFMRSCWRAASHSCADTTLPSNSSSVVFIVCSFSIGLSSAAKYFERESCQSLARCRRQNGNVCDAQRAHDSDLCFPRLACFFQISRQAIERTFPELSILLDPLRGFFQRLRVQFHFVDASVTTASQQSCFLENAQMF